MKRVDRSQLLFMFADSPERELRESEDSNKLEGKDYLKHIVKTRKRIGSTTVRDPLKRDLMKEVASEYNLAKALLRVASNQGAAGIDGKSVEDVVCEAHKRLPKLRTQLLTETVEIGEARRVLIPKGRGRFRELSIPNVEDRWMQQALNQHLSQIYEPSFHENSHGFRPQRGARTAIRKASEYIEEGKIWVVSIDLAKYFDTVNHQRLMTRLGQRIGDKRLLRLIHRMLKARVVLEDGTKVITEEGVPQGGCLSPLLANIVLDELDQELERRNLSFVRYADDINIYVRSERAGQRVSASISQFIEKRLRLKVNEEKSKIAHPREVHFLGFCLDIKDDKVDIKLSERTMERVNKRMIELTPRNWGSSLNLCFHRITKYLKGWMGYFKICSKSQQGKLRRVDAHTRRRLRAIIIKQKKRNRHLYRHLRARKIPGWMAARAAYGNRKNWAKSISMGMHRAYPNRWFHKRVFTLQKEWETANPPLTVSGQYEFIFS